MLFCFLLRTYNHKDMLIPLYMSKALSPFHLLVASSYNLLKKIILKCTSLIQQVLIGHFQLLVEREEKRKAQLKAAYDRWAAKSQEMQPKKEKNIGVKNWGAFKD